MTAVQFRVIRVPSQLADRWRRQSTDTMLGVLAFGVLTDHIGNGPELTVKTRPVDGSGPRVWGPDGLTPIIERAVVVAPSALHQGERRSKPTPLGRDVVGLERGSQLRRHGSGLAVLQAQQKAGEVDRRIARRLVGMLRKAGKPVRCSDLLGIYSRRYNEALQPADLERLLVGKSHVCSPPGTLPFARYWVISPDGVRPHPLSPPAPSPGSMSAVGTASVSEQSPTGSSAS